MGSEPEKTVYFVRHGQSEHNIAPYFQSPDVPLSPRGLEQAKFIADRAAKISFEALIASPYPRARQTAEAIAGTTGIEPVFSDLFTERRKPTAIDGKPYDDEAANALWLEWEESLVTAGKRVADGENYDDLTGRADAALRFLHERPERTLLVVTHGAFLRTIMARVVLGDLLTIETHRAFQRTMDVENTGVSVIRYLPIFRDEPRWRLWIFNDHAHLAE